eukprot:1328264-Pyramimonas_sp.AAC.1
MHTHTHIKTVRRSCNSSPCYPTLLIRLLLVFAGFFTYTPLTKARCRVRRGVETCIKPLCEEQCAHCAVDPDKGGADGSGPYAAPLATPPCNYTLFCSRCAASGYLVAAPSWLKQWPKDGMATEGRAGNFPQEFTISFFKFLRIFAKISLSGIREKN